MVDPDRRPTAQQIEELIDLVRRDPTSAAFIDLCEAYLNLGRPRDAIQVGNLGLKNNPDSLEGRVMVARAHAALHQWKEAQGELLRVVKADRNNRNGFALLGEVLLRRSDFERAIPVLQHAQNLDPTSPSVLAMLKRARANQQLDPPDPPPTPVAPRGETEAPVEIQRSPRSMGYSVPAAGAAMPTMAVEMHSQPQYRGLDALMEQAPHMMAPPGPRTQRPTAPPPMSVEGIKPRVIASTKQHNAAAAALRQSAAVGETYLHDLMMGGLLEIAGVRVPASDIDLRPDRRWGRSTRRGFMFLFVVLVLLVGGGGTWMWWSNKQKADSVARVTGEKLAPSADYALLMESLKKRVAARDKDHGKVTQAFVLEVGGISRLLYGEVQDPLSKDENPPRVDLAKDLDDAFTEVTSGDDKLQPGEPGIREVILGKMALELSRLPTDKPQLPAAFEAAQKDLDSYLETTKDDRWANWLKGRALLATGQRRAAASKLREASEGADGLAIAQIDYANLLVDDGKIDEALKLFKVVLDKSKAHPLAILGERMAKAEASIEVNEMIGDLNAKFDKDRTSSRVEAYRQLALAIANLAVEDYPTAIEAITKATSGKPPAEPRFWSRVAWVHLKLGRDANPDAKQASDFVEADKAYAKCIYFSKTPETDPTLTLVEAGRELSRGLPDKVLDAAAKIEGLRPRMLRTYALLDLGKAQEAYDEVSKSLAKSTNTNGKPCEEGNDQANIEAKFLCEQARMLAVEGERAAAGNVLLDLARSAKSRLGRHALGIAYLRLGDMVNAKEHLGQAIKVADTDPNPLLYRTHAGLAEVELAGKDLAAAEKEAREAIKINEEYLPGRLVLARVLVRGPKGLDEVKQILDTLREKGAYTAMAQLTHAEYLAVKPNKNVGEATKLLTDLKDKPGVEPTEIGRVALLVDPKLPEKLGVPIPAPPDDKDKKDKKDDPKPTRRGRR